MGIIIVIALFVLIGIALGVILGNVKQSRPLLDADGRRARDEYGNKAYETKKRPLLALFGLIPLGIALIITLSTSFTQVHAKEIGVVVSFGKPVAEVGPGLHAKAPWKSVTKIDETIKSDTYGPKAPNTPSPAGPALPVRLGDGNTATVLATIRWHVDPAAADYIYANYKSNDPTQNLRDAVVDTQFKAAVNEVLSQFNPTAAVTAGDATGTVTQASFSPNYTELAAQITASMNQRVKDGGQSLVVINSVTVANVNYSDATEARINAIIGQAAKTQQAIQAEQTAKAQAAANAILAASLSNDPNVLVSKCLDDLASGSFVAPAGFSCWPGGGSAVVIPGSAK